MINKVLVTGARGFLGRQAVAALAARGFEVHAIMRGPEELPGASAAHCGDLLDAQFRRDVMVRVKPDALLHLAWETTHGAFWTAASNLDWLNASLDLFRQAAGVGARRIVAAGTCVEYLAPDDGPCDEAHTPIKPSFLYGAAKAACAQTGAAFAAQLGLSFAWGRVFFLYGAHEGGKRLIPDVARKLLRGEDAPVGPGTAIRDFMDVRDAGAGFAALLASEVTGPVNVASGDGYSLAEIVTRLGQIAGRPDLIKLGALPARGGEPPMLVASNKRLTAEVGFTPAIPLDQGLADALNWWRGRA